MQSKLIEVGRGSKIETINSSLDDVSLGLEKAPSDPTKIAVLLNKNARQVNDKMAQKMERLVGRENFFYSRSLEEAEVLAREIVQRGYGTILSGGGDGTLCNTINMVRRYVGESNDWRRERFTRFGENQQLLSTPRFGFLRLGTGNGIGQVVGAKNALKDLRTIVDYAPGRTHELPLIQSDGQFFFFGGMGYDSILLNDYNYLKERTHHPILKSVMHGLSGYMVALMARTLPKVLFSSPKIDGRITTQSKAYYIDPRRGDAAVELEPGATLFEGAATTISAGTSPFYGYGFRMFPFSNIRPGYMHLRVTHIGAARILANLGSVWKGHYRNPKGVYDFLVKDFNVELNNPFPYQHSGDAQGMRDKLDMKVASEPLKLVDCLPPHNSGR